MLHFRLVVINEMCKSCTFANMEEGSDPKEPKKHLKTAILVVIFIANICLLSFLAALVLTRLGQRSDGKSDSTYLN